MSPITFSCEELLSATPADIARNILDLSRWPEFAGYGVIPGIKSAVFDRRTDDIIGTRIRVTSTDNSSYIEEITEWESTRITIEMKEFSAALATLAKKFSEHWALEPAGEHTKVTRTFQLYAKSFLTKIPLNLVAVALKKAVSLHLQQLKQAGG
jgi:Polyketide cyclase / dehydrase and lipid transport